MERYEITRGKKFVNTDKETGAQKIVIAFDLKDTVTGNSYYGLRLHEQPDGSWFTAFPSYEAKNGKFYHYYWLNLKEYEKELVQELLAKYNQ